MAEAKADTESFGYYSDWYDSFYEEKDYQAESIYVFEKVKQHLNNPASWLDVGCGTGRHAGCLQSFGLHVVGVDKSELMIARARSAFPSISFSVADAASFAVGESFDVATLLFHVMNYLDSDQKVVDSLRNIARHLTSNGILIFDFWHSAAVSRDPPKVTVKCRCISGRNIYRIATPAESGQKGRIRVDYEFRADSETGPLLLKERHNLRHFEVHQLENYLTTAGFEALQCTGWMRDRPISSEDWYGLMIARKTL